MGEEVEDGDLVPGGGSVGEVGFDGIAGFDFAALFEQEDAGRGELLGDGAEAEFGGGRIGDIPLQVGGAIALAEDYLAAARDQGCSHELVVGHEGLDDFIHPGGVLREARTGKKGEEWESVMHGSGISRSGEGGKWSIDTEERACFNQITTLAN